MNLADINRRYEEILHSEENNSVKTQKLSALMSDMEGYFKIPLLRNSVWESQNRGVIAMYRKVSLSRKFD